VHEHVQVALDVDDQVLADPAHALDRPAVERVQRRIERLQRVDARRERRLDRRAAQRSVQRRAVISTSGSSGTAKAESTLRAVAERLAIIGGDAAGMSAAAQALRRDPDLEVVAFERGPYTSYSACGIPYFIAQDFTDSERLIVRGPEEHRKRGIDVRIRHEVMAIDLDARELTVQDHNTRRERPSRSTSWSSRPARWRSARRSPAWRSSSRRAPSTRPSASTRTSCEAASTPS
jgi:hypothetical protein